MSGKIRRDSSFQELYRRVCKPRTETESNVTVILSGENRRDSDKPERYRRVLKQCTVTSKVS